VFMIKSNIGFYLQMYSSFAVLVQWPFIVLADRSSLCEVPPM
jgi:hypothetical protein